MLSSAGFFRLASRFWPGFQLLWWKGDAHSLLVSVLFSWMLSFTWLATFVWPKWITTIVGAGWFDQAILIGLWIAIVLFSIIAAIRSSITGVFEQHSVGERQKNLEFAQEYYLQANYFEAEKQLRKNIRSDLTDIESVLLWISVLRRTKRHSQALELIAETELLDASVPWTAELQGEKALCLKQISELPPAHD